MAAESPAALMLTVAVEPANAQLHSAERRAGRNEYTRRDRQHGNPKKAAAAAYDLVILPASCGPSARPSRRRFATVFEIPPA